MQLVSGSWSHRARGREPRVQFVLHRIVELYANHPATLAFDLIGDLMVEAVKVCVVVGSPGFLEAMVDSLALREDPPARQELVTVLSQRGTRTY